ncbi:MAG TPA: isoprenyl transferase [Syntrophorhabdaceae bacterium]|nr:isoprenyl transferase [Syntrophorhabdaceae bacterium]
MDKLNLNILPAHVAIIMDGNGRWARRKKLQRVEGHRVGMESVREIVTATSDFKIPYLTLYAFSKENWGRPKDEIQMLMALLGMFLEKEQSLIFERGIRINVWGEIGDFPKKLQTQMNDIITATRHNKNLYLNLALSYSGRREIIHAVTEIVEQVKNGHIKRINEKVFSRYLYAGNTPDPDLLIRTSGEMRISNFLLWQIAYTEIYLTETLWPDFRRDAYIEALREFARRERRFGKVKEV